ncbi:alpha-glucosidase [Limihaloglobus sulfuriphilus]|uniref:Alpha-glucosidase n=1 Tax=Limihaloglobus sulfuriphilus TaxID=1851148 RepID=A0A1R7T5S3_9BACT|nr:trehalase family glycosidase [Limihaloglobus sulfuriphilus]AQQ71683.1 alpha-glucosidase [Limihaloglobus sulfuriphilus]
MSYDFKEKTYWNACPVKNYGSILYLLPKQNTGLLKGPFLDEIGLKHFEVDGKVVKTKDDATMYRQFDYSPGRMHTEFKNFICPFISFEEELTAAGGESYRLRYTLRNRAHEDKEVTLAFNFLSDRKLEKVEKDSRSTRLFYDLNKKDVKPGQGISDFSYLFEWYIENKDFQISIEYPQSETSLLSNKQILAEQEVVVSQGSRVLHKAMIKSGQTYVFDVKLNLSASLETYKPGYVGKEWSDFVEKLPVPEFKNEQEKFVYYKSWHVLFSNEVHRRGVDWVIAGLRFPSIWVWDTSPFVADAYMSFDPGLVQGMILDQLKSIKTSGMMPLHAILGYMQPEQQKDDITQIPLVAKAAWDVFKISKDLVFAKKCYESFSFNYQWFESSRKPNDNVPLWGIDDKRAPYFYGPESGMDDCPIYDNGPVYSVGINSAKFSFEGAMAAFASVLGQEDQAKDWQEKQKTTRKFMLENMWHEKDSFCYPLTYELKKVDIKTSDIYPALYVGVLDSDKIKKVARVLESEFLTRCGMTSVSMKEECFNPDVYARGSVWPFMNYMVHKGLTSAGCRELADKVLDAVIKTLVDFPGVFECFNPVEYKLGRVKDGPVCTAHMSFCAAGVICMLLER